MNSEQLVYLGIGTNLGDKLANIQQCLTLLQIAGVTVLRTASIYESEPWGFEHKNTFFNTVFECKTSLSPEELLHQTQEIERQMGRVAKRSENYEARTLDIDILLYSEEVINNSTLTIPHPLLHLRNFVLHPLNELIPTHLHTQLKRSINELYESSTDSSKVFVVHFALLDN
jgi:2-amino-4-hydroxy-6-hydroxymethyldihydropteridine diphosphokinase